MVRNLVFGSGASFLVSFLSLILLARLFPLDFISDVKAVTIYGGWFSLVFTCQVHSAFLYYHNKPGGTPDLLKAFSLGFLIVAGILCGAVFYAVFPSLYVPAGMSRSGLLAFSFLVGLNLIFYVSPAVYTAQGSSKHLPIFMLLYPMCALSALLLSYLFKLTVNQYSFIATLLSVFVLASSEWRRYTVFVLRSLRSIPLGYSRPFGAYAGKISASIFFEALGDRVDKILASRFLAQAAFAKYSVLCFENPLVGVLLNSYGVAMVKQYHGGISGREQEFISGWEKMVSLITFVTFPISIFFLLNSESLISTIFGFRFLEAEIVFQIYLVVTLFRYAPFQALLRMEGLVHYNVIMSISFFLSASAIAAIVHLSGRSWQFMAVSYLVGWATFNGLAVFFFTRASRISLWKILALKIWVTRVAQCAVSGVIGHYISGRTSYLGLACSSAIYLAIVLASDPLIRKATFDQTRLLWRWK